MNNPKYLAGISIVGLVLILGLSANVSAMPYISIGDTTHNFTVVPGQAADITLPIMVKNINVSNVGETIKGLQFNVTFNCSMINITNITETPIVDVPGGVKVAYNNVCNNTSIPISLLNAWCFFMNTTLASDNKTNASVLFATVKNLGNGQCVLRIAFASYKNLTEDVEIGKIRMKVGAMPSYLNGSSVNTDAMFQMNITIERMGANHSVNIINDSSQSQTNMRVNGLIKACRGDANRQGDINAIDTLFIAQYTANMRNLDDIKDCLDVNGDGQVNAIDTLFIAQYTANMRNINEY
ncbi:MAG: hypothetical protein CVT89_03620 [Candidatus Altiarchaeales archaeon HGW-Altiarchaeales-2]|nr:MAG: hypothetical protein CVT89_03620 [Candidatus Altiarchaeales archaeon HGW-Altiarchaeales-2]